MLFDLTSCIKVDILTCTPKTCAMQASTCGAQGDGWWRHHRKLRHLHGTTDLRWWRR